MHPTPDRASPPAMPSARSRKQAKPATALTVPHVLAAIGLDARARSEVMATFKAAGGSLDRWAQSDRIAMAEAIARAEDALEARSRGRMTPAREALRAARRQLEGEAQ